MHITITATNPACAPDTMWLDYTAIQEPHGPLRGFLQVPNTLGVQEQEKAIRSHIQQRGGVTAFPNLYDMPSKMSDYLKELWESEHEKGTADINDQTIGVCGQQDIGGNIKSHNLSPYIMLYGDTLYVEREAHT